MKEKLRMGRLLVVVDMQNDFISGALGTPEAIDVSYNVAEKIRNWHGDIVVTMDTHDKKYLSTNEGKHLPVMHCQNGDLGWELCDNVAKAFDDIEDYYLMRVFEKNTFASKDLIRYLMDQRYKKVELVGVCTDICVIANALLIKTFLPEINVSVDMTCCAGTTPEAHEAAIEVMRSCHIDITETKELSDDYF